MWDKIVRVIYVIFSYLVALIRVFYWALLLLVSGTQKSLFEGVEICALEMKICPLRCDKEEVLKNLSYVDKLRAENPELYDDSLYEDDEINDMTNDEDDEDDGGDQFPPDIN